MTPSLHTLWQATVRRRSDDRAIQLAENGPGVTFRELATRAEHWAALHLDGIGDAVRSTAVVFSAPQGPGWFEIFLGLISRQAVVVCLDPAEPITAQRRLAADLRAGFLWHGAGLEALPSPRRFRDPSIRLIKLTSGSTGRPRPLPFSDAQMAADGRQVTGTMGITSRDLNYALIPLGHSYGLGNLSIPLIVQGIPLVIGSAPLPHAIAADFARWRPSVFPGVPALWRALAASEVTLPGLRLAISAGAPLDPAVAALFLQRFGQPLHSFYGSSETGGITYDRTGRGGLEGHVGTAMKGVRLTLQPGRRLSVSSAAVLTLGNRRRREGHGAWLMADRVDLDASGRVRLLGRRGTTVKLAGRRLDLGEVAARLRRLAGVSDVWVGVSDDREPVLGAAVASERDRAALRAELAADTPAWKVPKKWVVVPALPITERGKIDAAQIRQRLFGPPDSAVQP
ncbi:MAG: acyl--CoA ligase [Opitutaceae bacterium]|nr:acyl--CoA ligase [Opitutaceae bacterium]